MKSTGPQAPGRTTLTGGKRRRIPNTYTHSSHRTGARGDVLALLATKSNPGGPKNDK